MSSRFALRCLAFLCRPTLLVALLCLNACTRAQAPSVPDITADTSQLKIVETFASQSQTLARIWYPKIVKILGGEPADPPKQVSIIMDMNYNGAAATGGNTIHVSARYVLAHSDDLGMIVHELTHVIQAYPKYDPVWLVEGIADYVRWFNYEPVEARPHPDPSKSTYHDSYRTTASFLNFVVTHYDADLIHKLDHALKTGTYSPDLFRQATGKDLDLLNIDWLASLSPKQ